MDWRERMRDVWQRKFAGQHPQDPRSRAQQTRFLAYRGFPMDMIGRLLSGRDLDDY
ncbi:recombination regulator RecX [compost metagenome]